MTANLISEDAGSLIIEHALKPVKIPGDGMLAKWRSLGRVKRHYSRLVCQFWPINSHH